MMPDNQEHEALAEAERELRRISTIVDDEDTERPDEREALEVIEGLFRAGLWHAKMSGFEQQRLIERTERVLQRHGRKLPTGAMRDIERPDGDSHWATVVIDGAFEPREISEAEAEQLYESGIGIDVERMWIRPGVRDTEQEPER